MAETKDNKATIAGLKRELADAHRDLIRSSALFSSIGEGVITTNEYGRIEQVNDLCLDILDYSRDEMVGQRFIEVIRAVNEDGSPIEPIDRPITQAFLSGAPVSAKTYYLTKNNATVPVDINISPIIFGGMPSGAIEVFRDLTDQYIKEKIQSEFISIASHQLRTPLSSIFTYAQMLSAGYAGKLSSQQASFVSIIESASERMNELIHSLLNVTRLEAGNITVNVRTVEVDKVCMEIIQSLRPLAKDKGITISYTNQSTGTIETDPILLKEILSNLMTNGIKYTPEGGRITLKVDASDRIVFSVKDNGYGIPDHAKDYIFSKFYRANNAVQNDVSGTGIGLYLAKQVADRLEGDIWFSSKVNQGSTFYFSLPLVGSAIKQGKFTLEMPYEPTKKR